MGKSNANNATKAEPLQIRTILSMNCCQKRIFYQKIISKDIIIMTTMKPYVNSICIHIISLKIYKADVNTLKNTIPIKLIFVKLIPGLLTKK
jgi:hypothetical protein